MNTDQTTAPLTSQNLEVLTKLAIEAAVTSDWSQATKLNQKILTLEENNVEALNRLAKAYMCTGNIEKAQKSYKKVLELDQYNVIARKNVEKINKIPANSAKSSKVRASSQSVTHSDTHTNLSSIFLLEPGKTKTINLLNLASPAVLAILNCGDKVEIIQKKHAITITTSEDIYLGALPDDVAFKMLGLIGGGNKYEAYVKSATTKSLTIFIREIERSARYAHQPSFQESAHSDEKDTFFA